MILTLNVEYRDANKVKLLKVDEVTGTVTPYYLDPRNYQELKELKDLMDKGVTYADFKIKEYEMEDGTKSLELVHSAENYLVPQFRAFSEHNRTIGDEPTFIGFLRTMINAGALILTTESEEGKPVPDYNTVPAYSVRFTPLFKVLVSHLIPSEKEGLWRWASHTIIEVNKDDTFTDYSKQKFLCPKDFNHGEYEELIERHEPTYVKNELGELIEYDTISLKPGLEVFTEKSSTTVTPLFISRLSLISDTYKLALYTLTDGLFESKPIDYEKREYKPRVEDPGTKFFQLNTPIKANKRTADEMFDLLVELKQSNASKGDYARAVKTYPAFKGYESIIESKLGLFISKEVTMQQKYQVYASIKKTEALVNLLLMECAHTAVTGTQQRLKYWMANDNFDSKILYYPVKVNGGRGLWRNSY